MIEDRASGNGQDPATAEREVLTELGNPAQLAARYADRRLQLIGPTYYLAWLRLLKLPAQLRARRSSGVVVGLVDAADGDKAVGGAIGCRHRHRDPGGGADRLLGHPGLRDRRAHQHHARPARRGPSTSSPTTARTDRSPSRTPPRRSVRSSWPSPTCRCSTSGRSSRTPTAATCRSSTRRCGASGCRSSSSSWSPTLGFEIVKYRVGRWTWPLVATNALLDLAFAVPVVWLLLTDRLLSPELVGRFDWLEPGRQPEHGRQHLRRGHRPDRPLGRRRQHPQVPPRCCLTRSRPGPFWGRAFRAVSRGCGRPRVWQGRQSWDWICRDAMPSSSRSRVG